MEELQSFHMLHISLTGTCTAEGIFFYKFLLSEHDAYNSIKNKFWCVYFNSKYKN